MAKATPKFPASPIDNFQYTNHYINDNSTRFVVSYPGQVDIKILRQALRHMIDRVYILRSSFVPAEKPYWAVNDGYKTVDTVKLLSLEPGADVLAAAEKEALRPVYIGDTFQVYCALADNGSQSAMALVVSHLLADGGDAKYILTKLVELYNCIARGGEPDDVDIKNGDRDILQVFDNVDPEILKGSGNTAAPKGGIKASLAFPFPEPEDVGTPRILRRTISAEALAPARKKAKANGATVNDLLLAAQYRAAARLLGYSPDEPMTIMSMIDLRQFTKSGTSAGICNLAGPLSTSLPDGIGDSFQETLDRIAAQTQSLKGNGILGLKNMALGRIVVKGVFGAPYRLLKLVAKVTSKSLSMSMTNMGNMRRQELALDGMEPEFACFASVMKKKPAVQIATMSLDGAPTLTISNVCGDRDELLLHQLLALVEEEIVAYGQERQRLQ